MRKYRKLSIALLCIISAFLIFSCTNKKEDFNSQLKSEENSEGAQEERSYKIMEEFGSMVKKKDANLESMIDYIDENILFLENENADILIYTLEDKLDTDKEKRLKEIVSKDKDNEIIKVLGESRTLDEDLIRNIKNKELQVELEKLLKLKYVLFREKEDISVLIDYNKLISYDEFLSEELKDYLNIRSKILDTPTLYDGDFNIGFDDLGKRLLRYENYIVDYPKSKRYETILSFYRKDLINYLKGSKSEVIWTTEKGVNTKLLNSYKVLTKNKDSITSNIVRKYIGNLSEKNVSSMSYLEVEILSLVNEAMATIEDKVE